MKKMGLKIVILGVIALLIGCTKMEESPEINKGNTPQTTVKISESDAMDIANKVLCSLKPTRNVFFEKPSFDYVINEGKTRNSTLPDTLAYIINYPDDGGFVIVSSLNNVYPVLGFSDTGHFDLENEIAKVNFVDKIGAYIDDNEDKGITYEVKAEDFDGCYAASPSIMSSIGQGEPWDKYVIEEHPGCPVGCVAVATALVLSHSMSHITYHGSVFYFKSIVDAIYKKQNPNNPHVINPKDEWDNIVQPTYSYEQAVDSMAKLLYWIGKDLKMRYTPNGSRAYSDDAYSLCRKLRAMGIPSRYATFNIEDVIEYLKSNNIVYLHGCDNNGHGGHAWVSDGYSYCIDKDNGNMINPYIHCDWGWGGIGNGYFTANAFKVEIYNFIPTIYFALKKGNYTNLTYTPWTN